jgi:hypothetical protein
VLAISHQKSIDPGIVSPPRRRTVVYTVDAMRTPALSLDASTHDDRSAITWRVSEAIGASGASLLEARPFSNKLLALEIEVRAADLARLRDALAGAGLRLHDASAAALSALVSACADEHGGADPDRELLVWLRVTFVHDEADLAIDVPKVPG